MQHHYLCMLVPLFFASECRRGQRWLMLEPALLQLLKWPLLWHGSHEQRFLCRRMRRLGLDRRAQEGRTLLLLDHFVPCIGMFFQMLSLVVVVPHAIGRYR